MKTVLRFYTLTFLLLSLTACSTAPLHRAVPEKLQSSAVVTGFPTGIRMWADDPGNDLATTIEKRVNKYRERHSSYFAAHQSYPPMNYLALSGGGNNGAYAAGLLCGWTKAGNRPEFTIVTGVSTGALIAPFAFLGPKYDAMLRTEYTTISSKNIFLAGAGTIMRGLINGTGLVDLSPLKDKLDKIITPEFFAEIAAEHRKGRRLLIGTTNLEAQRGVIWNIGHIANNGDPKAGLKLFKEILLASAAIPGIFDPVVIDVEIEGKEYQEIHVDGGVTSQVFLFPLKSSRQDKEFFAKYGIERNLYIVRNGKINPEYLDMKPNALSISQRSIETLIKTQGMGDLYRLYLGSIRDGVNYRLSYIPSTFKEESKETFDPTYMSKLFEVGYRLGQSHRNWYTSPPGYLYVD